MSSVEDKVCELVKNRADIGLTKYGVSMERTDLSQQDWVRHAQEEALDLAVYLEKLKVTSNVLSEDDMLDLLALINVSQDNLSDLSIKYETIKKKLQNALNMA